MFEDAVLSFSSSTVLTSRSICPRVPPPAGPPAEGPAERRGHSAAGGPGPRPSAAAAEQGPAAAHLPAGETDPGPGDQDGWTQLQ